MRMYFWVTLFFFYFVSSSHGASGIISVKSSHDVKTTGDRLEAALQEKGMTVFIRIDHAAGAQKAGMPLRPTELIIVGNPQGGTALMQCRQSAGLDLPLKVLVWRDENGQTWFSYNDPVFLQQRHELFGCDAVLEKIKTALEAFAAISTGS